MPRSWTIIGCIFFAGLAGELRADLPSPAVVQTIPAQTLAQNGGNQTLNLYSFIQDPNVTGTSVRISVQVGNLSSGNIDLALSDSVTPLTVANFLTYINNGFYNNNIIHRSIPGFIFQGGEYAFSDFANDTLGFVPVLPAVQNEPFLSNVAGTIAMAKLSGNVNSATNQWFINMADNSSNLDNQNGGFTVFGHVIGNGMTVATTINTLSTFNGTNIAPDWTDIPLTAPNVNNTSFVRTSMAVVPAVTFSASSGNTSLVTVSLSGNTLTLAPSTTRSGNTTVTITTTDLEGSQLQTNFNVNVEQPFSSWVAPFNFSPSNSLATANPTGDGVPNLLKFAFGGNPTIAERAPGLPVAESGGGVTFYQRQLTGLNYVVEESFDLVTWTKIWQTSDGLAASAVAAHTSITGYDIITVRVPTVEKLRFWRVAVSPTL